MQANFVGDEMHFREPPSISLLREMFLESHYFESKKKKINYENEKTNDRDDSYSC